MLWRAQAVPVARMCDAQTETQEATKIYDDPYQEMEQLQKEYIFSSTSQERFFVISLNLPIALILPDVLAWGARMPWRGNPDWGHQRDPELQVWKLKI